MKDKLLAALKALYAIPTVYRIVWTSVQGLAGLAAGVTFHDPLIGAAVFIIVTAISSEAREHLARKRA